MLPSSLIQALFAFGGVCFLLFIYVFHYIGGKIEGDMIDNLNSFFSMREADDFMKKVKKGDVPLPAIKDFANELVRIGEPRREFKSLLLSLPLAGIFFIASASLAGVCGIESETIIPYTSTLEYLADLMLVVSFVIFAYSVYHLVRLSRKIS